MLRGGGTRLGITTAINELMDAGVFDEEWDVIIYDVLGDVVCGGFSVPMRQRYADRVVVVTSAAYMSLYAANNILKGVRRYSMAESSLFGGIILNHVHGERDLALGQAFADATGTSVLAALTEDEQLQLADYCRCLFVRDSPDSENARRLRVLVERLMERMEMPMPEPMSQPELEAFGQQMAEVLYGKRKMRHRAMPQWVIPSERVKNDGQRENVLENHCCSRPRIQREVQNREHQV